jgi:hypothetical protein
MNKVNCSAVVQKQTYPDIRTEGRGQALENKPLTLKVHPTEIQKHMHTHTTLTEEQKGAGKH